MNWIKQKKISTFVKNIIYDKKRKNSLIRGCGS